MKNSTLQYGIISFLLVSLFFSCDIENYLGDTDPGGNIDTEMESVITILNDAETTYYEIYSTQGESAAAIETLKLLEGNPDIEKAGISSDSTVYIFFKNGILGVIMEESFKGSQIAPSPGSWYPSLKAGGETYKNGVAILPFLTELPGTQLGPIEGYLDKAYLSIDHALQILPEGLATVEAIRNTLSQGPGVLFWAGHGALVPLNPAGTSHACALMTGESYPTEGAAVAIRAAHGGILAGPNRHLAIISHRGRHYLGVLPEFIRAHGNFRHLDEMPVNQNKNIAYISCCYGHVGISSALIDVGVEACYGWTDEVGDIFAQNIDRYFFKSLTDTCTTGEAYKLTGDRYGFVDQASVRKAKIEMTGDEDVMVEAVVRAELNGTPEVGVTPSLAIDDVVAIGGWFGEGENLEKTFSIAFPSVSREAPWDCTRDEDVMIAITYVNTIKSFVIQKDYVGVGGTIKVNRFDDTVVSIEFSATLGYWYKDKNPHVDPPDETLVITNGFLKHSGIRF